jgi:chaperonin GroES
MEGLISKDHPRRAGTLLDGVLAVGLISIGTLPLRVPGITCLPAEPAPATTELPGGTWYANPIPQEGMSVTTATKVAIRPLEDRIVVQANEAETTTASGLVIPDTAKEKPQEGTVLAVGPGRFDDKGSRVPVDVKAGDTVIYSKYGGTEIKWAGEEYLILSARDVLAVVEK